jgi:hypothetical protein
MIDTFLIAFLVAFNVATVWMAGRRELQARQRIAELMQSFVAEQRLVTLLREMFDLLGITTEVQPRSDGYYDLKFSGHTTPRRIQQVTRYPWPIGRGQ